jgi:hypothetical protein
MRWADPPRKIELRGVPADSIRGPIRWSLIIGLVLLLMYSWSWGQHRGGGPAHVP